MRGLTIQAGEVLYQENLPAPVPKPGEVRVQVRLAGVCATDLALARGYMDFRGVPGHEFVGEALEGPLKGRRVVGEINAACGKCDACRADLGRHCPHRDVLGILGRSGAFAEVLCLPQENLVEVPDDVTDEQAVFAEPLAAAFEIVEQVDVLSAERALVVGDGRLGLLCAQVLGLAKLPVTLVGRHPERGDWLGGTVRHAGGLEAVGEERFGLVVEATGSPDVFVEALARTAPRGTLVLKTTSERPVTIDLAPLVVDEISVIGSRCGRFLPAVEALASGAIETAPMIHARYPLASGPEAFRRAGQRGTLKVLLDPLDQPT